MRVAGGAGISSCGRAGERMKFYQVKTARTTRLALPTGRFSLCELPRCRSRMWCMIPADNKVEKRPGAARSREGESSEQTDPCVWKRGPARILRHRPRTGATAATRTPVLAGPSARTAPGRARARAGSRGRAQAMRRHGDLAERGGFPIFEVGAHAGGQGASGSRRDRKARHLLANRGVVIEGHTDRMGSHQYNQKLSE